MKPGPRDSRFSLFQPHVRARAARWHVIRFTIDVPARSREPDPWRHRGPHLGRFAVPVRRPDDWRDVASCRDTDPDLFFPVGTTGPAIEQIETAKAVCDQCEAKAPCLEFALTTNQDSGVWGGTSEEERRKLRRQWLAAKRRASLSRPAVHATDDLPQRERPRPAVPAGSSASPPVGVGTERHPQVDHRARPSPRRRRPGDSSMLPSQLGGHQGAHDRQAQPGRWPRARSRRAARHRRR